MKYDRTIIAYHGCDASTAERWLAGESFKPSDNDYDWLGSGIYFWEFGFDRALRFAKREKKRGRLHKAAVVGAIVQLGNCCDLMDTRFTNELPFAFERFREVCEAEKRALPVNEGNTPDRNLRRLDCAVLNLYLASLTVAYDSVRCGFVEGAPAFRGSGIHHQSHVQIAVRNPACVVGVFRPR